MPDLPIHEKGSNHQPPPGQPFVSVQETRIGIQAALRRRHFSGADAVVFRHDANMTQGDGATTLAIEPVDEDHPHGYKLQGDSSTATIHAKSVIDECGIDPGERYEAEWDDDRGYLVVDLTSKIE